MLVDIVEDENDEEGTPKRHDEWSTLSLVFVMGILVATFAVVVLATVPFATLLGPSAYALGAALHGLTAFILLVNVTIGLYLGWRLFMGRIGAFPDLQIVTTVMATLSFLTIASGNWIYMAYRADTPDSPRSYFLATMPDVHNIFFEFKAFTALFTLPLSVAAAFIAWRYGREIVERGWTRRAMAVLIALCFFYFTMVFGLGAAVTKLKAI